MASLTCGLIPFACRSSTNSSNVKEKSSSACVTSKKSVSQSANFKKDSVHLDSYLETYQKSKDMVVVESLCIYRTPLQQGPKQQMVTQMVHTLVPLLPHIYHHFLVFEVTTINGRLLIRAEKSRGNNIRKPGISVRNVPYVEEKETSVKYKVDDICECIPVNLLLKILTMHPPKYDVMTDNCWTYADHTFRRLLQVFELLRPERRNRIKAHRERIPNLVMPAQFGRKVLESFLVQPCMEIRIIPYETDDES
ncbi:unnamed protein product [Calypogeia fissa]